jgi:hypothetical protein
MLGQKFFKWEVPEDVAVVHKEGPLTQGASGVADPSPGVEKEPLVEEAE